MAIEKLGKFWSFRKRVGGIQVELSLRTADKKIATTRYNRFLATVDSDGLAAAKAQLSGKSFVSGGIDPSVDEMVQLYQDYVSQSGKPPAANTVHHNIGCLRRLMKGFESVSKIDPAKITVKGIYGASQIRAAKSIFKPNALKYYKSRNISLSNPFAEIELGSFKTQPYVPMGAEIRTKIWNEAEKLPPLNALIVLLALGAGLRRNEIDKARLGWLRDEGSGKSILTVQQESDFNPKSRVRRSIGIPTAFADNLRQLRESLNPRKNDPYLLPDAKSGGTGSLRHLERYKEVSTWLKGHQINDQKPLHALRKEFGSLVASNHGIFSASTVLGHSSVVITQESYASLVDAPTIDISSMIVSQDPLSILASQHGVTVEDLKVALSTLKDKFA